MSTIVSQTYTASLNVSVTHRDGLPTKVTLWTTGVSGSTQRVVDVPQVRFSHKR